MIRRRSRRLLPLSNWASQLSTFCPHSCVTALIWINEIIFFVRNSRSSFRTCRSPSLPRTREPGTVWHSCREGWPCPSARLGRSRGYVARRSTADGAASVIGESLSCRNIPHDLRGKRFADSRDHRGACRPWLSVIRQADQANHGDAWAAVTVRPIEQQVLR